MLRFLRYLFGFTPPPSVERSRKGREFEAEAHRVHMLREAAWERGRAQRKAAEDARNAALDRAARRPGHTNLSHMLHEGRMAAEREAIESAQNGDAVPFSIPREVDGYAAWVEREAAAAKQRAQGPDESAVEHNADPRGDSDLVIGMGYGRVDRIPEPAKLSDRWTGGPPQRCTRPGCWQCRMAEQGRYFKGLCIVSGRAT